MKLVMALEDLGSTDYWISRTTEHQIEVSRRHAGGSVWFAAVMDLGVVLNGFASEDSPSGRRLVVLAPVDLVSRLDLDGVDGSVFDVLALPIDPIRLRLVLRNAFQAIDHATSREAATRALIQAENEERTLMEIAGSLASERNIDTLLSVMLSRFRGITSADAGSIWTVEHDEDGKEPTDAPKRLLLRVAQNDTIQVDAARVVIDINDRSIVGYAAKHREAVHLPDCYHIPESAPYRFSTAVDEQTGYRTRSMLTVPMVNRTDDVVGVIQLINRKRDAERIIRDADDFDREVLPFGHHEIELATTLAANAAISIENASLYQQITTLFDSFVEASVLAIESRDPTTSGHSHRVAMYSLGLLEAVDRADTGPFADVHFRDDDYRTMRYASLLHDFGKVGVREDVLLKPKKLRPLEMERVERRFHYAIASLEARHYMRALAEIQDRGFETAKPRLQQWEAEMARARADLVRCLEKVQTAVEPQLLEAEVEKAIESLGDLTYVNFGGAVEPLLQPEEVKALSIKRGSLSNEERKEIEMHVVYTHQFLSAIPWSRELRHVPEVAGKHHEKLDGTGYPWGCAAAEIPLQAQMMTITDIYDALTAADRPYKKAVPIDRALDILGYEKKDGKINADLLQIFIEAKVYALRWDGEGGSE